MAEATRRARGAPTVDATWSDALARVIGTPRDVSFAFQPICDLHEAVPVGYEALARLPSVDGASTEDWLRAASACDRRAELEAMLLGEAIRRRGDIPTGCYLAVNLSPRLLLDPDVRVVLEAADDLSGLVIELTEDEPLDVRDEITDIVRWIRGRGGRIAVDDLGARYAGLQWIMQLRPDFMKLDRSVIHGIEHDIAKEALCEAVGLMADRLDGTVIAEGIETNAELDAVLRLGVPNGQGYLCGAPAAAPAPLDRSVSDYLSFASHLSRGRRQTA